MYLGLVRGALTRIGRRAVRAGLIVRYGPNQ
jgi:hypothetical protein